MASEVIAGALAAAAWLIMQSNDDESPDAFRASLPPDAQPYANILWKVGKSEGIAPSILAAIMMRESRAGAALTPKGPGGKGDGGHGHGLMQIDDRSWGPWLAKAAWWDPETNIRQGAKVYKQGLRFLSSRETVSGLVEGGKVIVPASAASARGVAAGSYPDPRPLQGAQLQRAAIAAYNTGMGNVLRSVAVGKDPDVTTANANYAADVLTKAGTYYA